MLGSGKPNRIVAKFSLRIETVKSLLISDIRLVISRMKSCVLIIRQCEDKCEKESENIFWVGTV